MKTFMGDLLGNLGSEDAPVQKAFSVSPSRLDALVSAYHEVDKKYSYAEPHGDWWYRDPYPMAVGALKQLAPITPEDLVCSINCLPHIKTLTGDAINQVYPAFIGVLMNLCHAPRLIVPAFPAQGFAEYFGVPDELANSWASDNVHHYKEIPSTKKVICFGSTGYASCSKVAAGIVHIKGNTVGVGYRQRGGEIIIDGDVTQWAGHHMQGGILRINGTLKGNLAANADRGEIHVKRVEGKVGKGSGNIIIHIDELIGEIEPGGATVYVAGKKVYERWEKV